MILSFIIVFVLVSVVAYWSNIEEGERRNGYNG